MYVTDSTFKGLPVWFCFPGSPAECAGVKQGDIVVIANGHRIDSVGAYVDAREIHRDRLELTVQRGNRVIDFVIHFNPNWREEMLEQDPAALAGVDMA
jgi:predicted metalloprotease with PDZ domain